MLVVALKYKPVVDAITADKTLNLRTYELLNLEWEIIQDLVNVLEVK